MKQLRYSLLAAAALTAGLATGAGAADFRFPPAPVTQVPAPIPVPEYSAWYLRGDVGGSLHEDPDLNQVGAAFSGEDMDQAWIFGVGFGHYFTDSLRGDVTIDYRASTDVTGLNTVTGSIHSAELSSTVVLANLYLDIRGRDDFTPYVGAGVGFASNETNGHRITLGGVNTGGAGGDTKFAVAAAAMAGFSYRLHDGWLFDAGYRFLYLGDAETKSSTSAGTLNIDSIYAHELRLGFRYELP